MTMNYDKNTMNIELNTNVIELDTNEIIYINHLTDQINKISIFNFNKGIYNIEISSNNNKILKKFEIK